MNALRSGLPPWLEPALARAVPMPAHALLLHGPGALGQWDLALAMAAAWLCEADTAGRAPGQAACGACASCRLLAARSHPDLRILVPEAWRARLGWTEGEAEEGAEDKASKAKPSREIRVDAVRSAIEWGQRSSARGRAKVIVIHPSEAMNAVTANALLKTLEEPPGRLRLVLTAHDPEALLPTVRSRCQRVQIDMPVTAVAAAWLAAQDVVEPDVLLAAAGGLPQAALDLAAEGIDSAAWQGVPAAVRRGSSASLAAWPVPRVGEALGKLAHDLLCTAAGGAARYYPQAALAPLTQRLPPLPRLIAWSRSLARAARHEDHPWHASLRIEALVSEAAALWQTPRDGQDRRARAADTLTER
ncbi:MAG TPA: DNA polymerase III subunit delta' [Burkholderiaceae bacterium]|nr:DNA polymerase III subunit delta' [Burkholderiaceae bacterium]